MYMSGIVFQLGEEARHDQTDHRPEKQRHFYGERALAELGSFGTG
jgi:hypothetical protein